MSAQNDGFDSAEIIDIYRISFTEGSFVVAGVALLLYEWIVTINQEIKHIWNGRFTGASVLFCLIRYTTLIAHAFLNLVSFANMPDSGCALLIRIEKVVQVVQYLPWAAFAALRVLALSRMQWSLSIVVFVLSLGPPIINAMQFGYGLTGATILKTGCGGELSEPHRTTIITTVISRSTLITADVIVICATIWATRRHGMVTTRLKRLTMASLADVLLCDGLLYFWTITCFNVADLVLTLVSIATPQYQTSYVTVLSDPMTAVLLCRFLLDLQAADQRSRGLGDTGSRGTSPSGGSANATGTLRFASPVIGSLGASLGGVASQTINGVGDDVEEYDDQVESIPA